MGPCWIYQVGPGSSGGRGHDHRIMGGLSGMQGFMSEGNIRLIPETQGLNIVAMPSQDQFNKLREFIETFKRKNIKVDLSDGFGDFNDGTGFYDESKIRWSHTYDPYVSTSNVFDDIKTLFKGGTPRPREKYDH